MSKNQFAVHAKKITEKNTAEYFMPEMANSEDDPAPVLILRSPSESNKEYNAAMISLTNQADGQRKRKKLKMDADFFDDVREKDRILYPLCVVVGWRNVLNIHGVELEYSKQACEDLFEDLPNWAFDPLRAWAGDVENFIPKISKDTGKNLPKG
jgi:hypothetical protein